jgi:hypothetical protein
MAQVRCGAAARSATGAPTSASSNTKFATPWAWQTAAAGRLIRDGGLIEVTLIDCVDYINRPMLLFAPRLHSTATSGHYLRG